MGKLATSIHCACHVPASSDIVQVWGEDKDESKIPSQLVMFHGRMLCSSTVHKDIAHVSLSTFSMAKSAFVCMQLHTCRFTVWAGAMITARFRSDTYVGSERSFLRPTSCTHG